ncbi:MAG: hypothetical protein SGPRY_000685, partial [Prymnesium sp.]
MEFGTLRLAVRFFRDERLRAPVLVVSMAVLGYSLHAPVISFFFLQLHLTPVQIGMLGAISSVGTMLLSPLYGWLLDTHGAYHAILFSSSMCALGCLVRGCATSATSLVLASVLLGLGGGNLITLVCAHLSSRTPRAERAPLLSAYLSLLSILNIGGKALYVPFDALLYNLGVSNLMLRYRITMSVCTFFCFFGVIKLWHSGRLLRARGVHDLEDECSIDAGKCGDEKGTQSEPAKSDSPCSARQAGFLALVLLSLWLRAASVTLARTLWPLWLKSHFGWGA